MESGRAMPRYDDECRKRREEHRRSMMKERYAQYFRKKANSSGAFLCAKKHKLHVDGGF